MRYQTASTREEADAAADYARLVPGAGVISTLLAGPAGMAAPYLIDTPALTLGEQFSLRPHHRVLVLGCGGGELAALIAGRFRLTHTPVGVDIAPAQLP